MKKLLSSLLTSVFLIGISGCTSPYFSATLANKQGELIPVSKISRNEEFIPTLYSTQRLPKNNLIIKSKTHFQEEHFQQIKEEYYPEERIFSYSTVIRDTNFNRFDYTWVLRKDTSQVERPVYTIFNGLLYQLTNKEPFPEKTKTRVIAHEVIERE